MTDIATTEADSTGERRRHIWPRGRRPVPRHSATAAAALTEPRGRHATPDAAAPGTGSGHPGWDAEHELLMPGPGPVATLAASPIPAGDETMLFRVPGTGASSGFTIPPGTLRTDSPENELPHRSAGAAIPAATVPVLRTEPADPDLLRDLRDALQALPARPQHDPGEDKPAAAARRRPVAWLRVTEQDGSMAHEALTGAPEFAGTDTFPDGTVIAGMYLGIHGHATWLVDAVDPAWCDGAITALTAMRDRLTAAREQAEGGAAA